VLARYLARTFLLYSVAVYCTYMCNPRELEIQIKSLYDTKFTQLAVNKLS